MTFRDIFLIFQIFVRSHLELLHAEGSEPQTLVLAKVQLNLAIPQIGRGDLFWIAQSTRTK